MNLNNFVLHKIQKTMALHISTIGEKSLIFGKTGEVNQ